MDIESRALKVPNTSSPLSDAASKLLAETVANAFQNAKSDIVYEWIAHKHRHTIGVLHAFRRIAENPSIKLTNEQFDRAEAACLLHDLGRFYEHNGTEIFGF